MNHLQFCNKITKGLTCQAKELRFYPVTIADAKKKIKICWKNGVMIPATSLLTIIVLRPLPRLSSLAVLLKGGSFVLPVP